MPRTNNSHTERTNKKQNEIKDSQEKLKELIINRNEIDAEKTGTLSIEQCVLIVGQIKRRYVELKKRDCRSIGIPPETVGEVNEKNNKTVCRILGPISKRE